MGTTVGSHYSAAGNQTRALEVGHAGLSRAEKSHSLVTAFLAVSPFRPSPLSVIPPEDLPAIPSQRLHSLLLGYFRLIVADPYIASRSNWSAAPLHILRAQHTDRGVRSLAIQILSKQRGWSEVNRQKMEQEWVGAVDEVGAEVTYGKEVVKLLIGGFDVRQIVVSGWMVPVFEARRPRDCEWQSVLSM